MEDLKARKKELRKAYKKDKRRTVTPWKVLCILCALVMVVSIPLYLVLNMFDNTVAAFVGGTFWTVENEDPNAQYFTSDFASTEEMIDYGLTLCQRVEEEGAALLLNENNALPLQTGSAVSCFSTSSVNLVYGGTGSGNIDASTADNLKTALEKVGCTVNQTLWDFYKTGEAKDYARVGGTGVMPVGAATNEAPWSVYTDAVKGSFAQYGDAAIMVISRVGGEGADSEYVSTNYLALDDNERELMSQLAALKQDGTFQRLIVLINSANAVQVDFLQDNEYGVDACLWIGDVGISGINAVAEILTGRVNPSGSLVDTYCYNNFSSPAMSNFTPITYAGYQGGEIPSNASTYMIYQEGIYVGYKYYETRYEDAVMGTGNAGDFDYDSVVAFPFGYGLSYTSFEYSDFDVQYDSDRDQYLVTVCVTNTGDVAGKEPVQIYAQTPYTDYDRENGVEKAAVQLVGFGKTGLLQPGESETVTVTVDRRELASFDTYGAGTYILDAGDYYLTAATDAHNAVENILTAKGYLDGKLDSVDKLFSGEVEENQLGDALADALGDVVDLFHSGSLTYRWTEDTLDTTTYATSKNGTAITNQLSSADPNLNESCEDTVVWLSRSDWEGTLPRETVQLALTEALIADLQDVQYNSADYEPQIMPRLGAKNGMTLYQMIGKDYDDPDWDKLLDQLTFDEMVALIGDSFHWRMPVVSVQAPGTRDENGPQGLTASLLGSDKTQLAATAFTSEDVMAATFNTDLMYEIGKVIGNNCLQADIVCLYGPGNNIHRTPYGGRNFEYYSEDGFLSGKMSAYEVKGIEDKGVNVVMKHFALNDCEQDRIGLGVWVSEQAARDIYLKAFQAPFEEGGANGVMTAYTRWGTQWSGGHKGLMTGILRGEWGSNGFSITDNVLTTYVNGVDGVLAGVTTFDAMLNYVNEQLPKYKNDAVVVNAMREACHHNLYALANSSGMNGIGANTTIKTTRPTVVTMAQIIACAASFFFLLGLVLWILGVRKFRKTEGYQNWKAFKREQKAAKTV